MREVACLITTRFNPEKKEEYQVLLMSSDGLHWMFPGTEMQPEEHAYEAIQRKLCSRFDVTDTEECAYPEGRHHRYISHDGVDTNYHIFTTSPEKLSNIELRSNGATYVWTSDPHSLKLNECTENTLREYQLFPKK